MASAISSNPPPVSPSSPPGAPIASGTALSKCIVEFRRSKVFHLFVTIAGKRWQVNDDKLPPQAKALLAKLNEAYQ